MSEYFGPISPFVLTGLAAALTQWIKTSYPGIKPRIVQLIALGFNVLLIVPFVFLTTEAGWLTLYEAIVYSLMAWLNNHDTINLWRYFNGWKI